MNRSTSAGGPQGLPSRRTTLLGALATTGLTLALPAPAASAAAPTVSHLLTTTLTRNGRTALTYTGYMNGESFQQDGITTYRGWQYAAFWDESGYVNVSRRKLPTGAWQNVQLTDYRTTSTDSHNTISIGICPADGTLHLAYDMHSSQLRYRRSAAGLLNSPDTASWTRSSFGPNTNGLTGTPLETVTYPQFMATPEGALQLAIRTGLSGAGDEVLFEYSNRTWTRIGTFINGTAGDDNPYLFGIEYDTTGLLHVTWCVRETPNPSTNHDLYYAYSRDRGRTWRNNAGTVVATTGSSPLIADTAGLRVWSIAQNRGLINQESMVVDSAGHVHVLASHLPAGAASTSDFTAAREQAVLVHYRRDKASKAWSQTYTPFLERSSRGDIGVDAQDNLYVVSGDSKTRKLHLQTASRASGWKDWALRWTSSPDYYSDPLLDHPRLRSEGVVSFFTPRYGGSVIEVQDWRATP
ncbi:putative BNR repeat neuraminidase [Kineococcus xinjiangensis]|uniref:Putative BNR repeat neuraminidase n=1 Tax=Kineococcus xinjiangensis TaxID=512762 RepID=A0A2S6IFI3_9ACTN|nr:BNR repeat-containing protein [Kineococcus xinjiangensis]PPK92946.1 putative BNR repeat neuraminidase [Kineococcus xinjiangensis]